MIWSLGRIIAKCSVEDLWGYISNDLASFFIKSLCFPLGEGLSARDHRAKGESTGQVHAYTVARTVDWSGSIVSMRIYELDVVPSLNVRQVESFLSEFLVHVPDPAGISRCRIRPTAGNEVCRSQLEKYRSQVGEIAALVL